MPAEWLVATGNSGRPVPSRGGRCYWFGEPQGPEAGAGTQSERNLAGDEDVRMIMGIRVAERPDLGRLAEIWHEGWHDGHAAVVPEALARLRTRASFRERLEAALPDIRVAGTPGAPVGFSILHHDELYQLYVAAPWWESGVAAARGPFPLEVWRFEKVLGT